MLPEELYNKQISSTWVGANHETNQVLNGVKGVLVGDKEGTPVMPPYAQPGADAEIGNAFYAQYLLFLDGPDGNPGYEPKAGEKFTAIPLEGESGRSTTLKIVSKPISYEGQGLDSWVIPACEIKVNT